MFPIAFHLTDKCNIRCDDCHWFSGEINEAEEVNYLDYLNFINNNIKLIESVRFSGGEPTLYSNFPILVDMVPREIKVFINTNGVNIEILNKIKRRKNIELIIGNNRETDNNFKTNIRLLGFNTTFVTYLANLNETKNSRNQITESNIFDKKNLIGKNCLCSNNKIRFGSDGYAYICEIGLRTKDENLRCDFSLWEGTPKLTNINCILKDNCFSNFTGENKFKLI
jgi:uncharacterized radical SAM superfamily Fe-S cluster-containing enzyme